MATPPCQLEGREGPLLCAVCRLSPPESGVRHCSRVIAQSPAMRALLTRLAAIAQADVSVVIHGESGTGKEVVARTLHSNSRRKAGPFVAVNTAAIPADLLESELFGHAKGSFTGATADKTGLFQAAHGGTLFLDEIAEMPLALQAKLLRALQDGEVRRVGDTAAHGVDVRILCATHEDLSARVEDRRFREDLYYRLKVFALEVPPLRERREDILPLAAAFLAGEGSAPHRFTGAAAAALEAYRWPGNVRELQNAVKHGAVLAEGRDVDVADLPAEVTRPPTAQEAFQNALKTLAEVEREHVLRVLEACGGHPAEAARVLGIGRTTLWRKLQTWGVHQDEPGHGR